MYSNSCNELKRKLETAHELHKNEKETEQKVIKTTSYCTHPLQYYNVQYTEGVPCGYHKVEHLRLRI